MRAVREDGTPAAPIGELLPAVPEAATSPDVSLHSPSEVSAHFTAGGFRHSPVSDFRHSASENSLPEMSGSTENTPTVGRRSVAFVKSQRHLTQATADNPTPTAVPPPIASLAGTLGDRHVLILLGLPERGKPFIANRLSRYLSFFHGADVKIFDLFTYIERTGTRGSEQNAELLLGDLRGFMNSTSAEVQGNIDACAEVNNVDRRHKHVDSGKVAIITSSNAYAAFEEHWGGTSKERRRWVVSALRADTAAINAKVIFIEVIVTREKLLLATAQAKMQALMQHDTSMAAQTSAPGLRELRAKTAKYNQRYVTLQDDGSEDDLSYIKLINYGEKVVTNRMNGYLRMRIAQFLSVVHPTRHTIYLTRHGQSEYNVLGKIGGNPPLSQVRATS